MLNIFPFIQRTEQVLNELDISAIEEYVVNIIIMRLQILHVKRIDLVLGMRTTQ